VPGSFRSTPALHPLRPPIGITRRQRTGHRQAPPTPAGRRNAGPDRRPTTLFPITNSTNSLRINKCDTASGENGRQERGRSPPDRPSAYRRAGSHPCGGPFR
jgi:hypothetical protein